MVDSQLVSGRDPGLHRDYLDAPPEPARVRFGDRDNQTMPHEWAEQFIRIVYAEHPAVFRSVLPRCAGLPAEEPKRRRT